MAKAINLRNLSFEENYWSRKARESREVELNWRVKENIVDTLMSFTWFVHGLPSHCILLRCTIQDMDAFCNRAVMFRMLYYNRGREAYRFEGIHLHCAFFTVTGTDDRPSRTSLCHVTR